MGSPKTSYDPADTEGLDGLSASAQGSDACVPCESPYLIAVYPLRIAWADLLGEVDDGFTYPDSLSKANGGNGFVPRRLRKSKANAGNGFTLRRLRKGYLYIRDTAAAVWSVFEFTPDETATGGKFQRLEFDGEAENGPWMKASEAPVDLPYLPDSADEIELCYASHLWSPQTFARAEADTDGFRAHVMTRLTLSAPADGTFSAPLADLARHAEEFSGRGIVNPHEDWTALSDQPLVPLSADAVIRRGAMMGAKSKTGPVLVALHDPEGVAAEICMCHANRVGIRTRYLEVNSYAILSGQASKVLQNAGRARLDEGGLGWLETRNLNKWMSSIRPERDVVLDEIEARLASYDDALEGILNAWRKFFDMGRSAPLSTPGSLQTHSLQFDPDDSQGSDIAGRIRFAQISVAAITGSKAGIAMLRDTVFAQEAWAEAQNPVASAIRLVTGSASMANLASAHVKEIREAASSLMTDISMPLALEIVTVERVDMLKEINRFSNGIVNHRLTRVTTPISDVYAEIAAQSRTVQSGKLIARGHQLNTVRTPTNVYKVDGIVHVATDRALDMFGTAGAGFAIFGNVLNIVALSSTSGPSLASGRAGRFANNPGMGIALNSAEALSKAFELSRNALMADMPATRSFVINGQLDRTKLAKLVNKVQGADDLVRVMVNDGKMVQTGQMHPEGSRLARNVGRIGSVVGLATAVMDALNAWEAYKRSDMVAIGAYTASAAGGLILGSLLFIGVPVAGQIVGIILLIIGGVLALFIDDTVTKWLKNSYWGTSAGYLYWKDGSRSALAKRFDKEFGHAAQVEAIRQQDPEYYEPRFMERELQEFHQIVYWPRNARDPAALSALRDNGVGFFRRTTTHTESSKKYNSVSFRLPNYIDGLSQFDGKIFAYVQLKQKHGGDITFQQIDVTDQFKASMELTASDVVTGGFTINAAQNIDDNLLNNVYWDVIQVKIVEGWSYEPTADIAIPMNYSDFIFKEGYSEDELGGKNSIEILG
ncbi:toxin VasX [Rhodovulum sulfidophilum]|uniref:toxin VasX n=1 Tax=Rhodovulum sulfidophilum TaxID=35806 RepID=UPI0009520EBB|nr:toxin VasX [Rhodovulum sulfidophilum]MBL3553935.1 hypothetical protein [Rhodovulum sulfidophilum]OLS46837.1 hypothetical protein BV379_00050 [Rhodovulum sulfidophilum]